MRTIQEQRLRQFTKKKLIWQVVINLLVNTLVPYYNFSTQPAVHLFRGEQPLARYLFPMSLLLPFLLTWDISRKAMALLETGEEGGWLLPDSRSRNRYLLRLAGVNTLVTILPVLAVTLGLHVCLPADYPFNAAWLSVLLGLWAGVLAAIFTVQPVNRVKKLRV